MAPINPIPNPLSLEHFLLPPLWLLVATALPSRTRLFLPLIFLTICLALHPFLTAPSSAPPHSLNPVFRQIPQPAASPLPVGQPPPSPSATPAPQQSPPPVVPAQQVPPFSQPAETPIQLGDCEGGLKRMQVVLLLELCFEIIFLFLRCFAEQERDNEHTPVDVTMRGYIFLRAIYVVPVLAINAGIYWVGGGPTGSCLSTFSAVQVPFVHLIFYAIYCVIIVIIGVYRIEQYEKNSQYYSDEYDSNGPPTRTTSYFRSYGRRQRHDTSSSSYEEPKFRVNLGCCRINF